MFWQGIRSGTDTRWFKYGAASTTNGSVRCVSMGLPDFGCTAEMQGSPELVKFKLSKKKKASGMMSLLLLYCDRHFLYRAMLGLWEKKNPTKNTFG